MPVTAANVRDVVTCSDCGKPRCLFAAKKLGKEEAETLQAAKEDVDFVCSRSIFAPDHPLASKVGTRLDISCSTDVTSHYFASKRGLPLVCFKCGSASPFPSCCGRGFIEVPVCTAYVPRMLCKGGACSHLSAEADAHLTARLGD